MTDIMQGTDSPSPEKSPTHLSREQILTVTAGCLHELGYEATTIRQIAGRLQCAVGSIYRYFTDKRELMLEVAQRMFEPVLIMLDADGSFEDSAMLYHVQATQDLEAYRLMFWLTCVGNNASNDGQAMPADTYEGVTPPPLPRDIYTIIDRWADRIGSPDAALRAWAVMHGAINAGLGAATTLAAMQAAAKLDGLKTIPHSPAVVAASAHAANQSLDQGHGQSASHISGSNNNGNNGNNGSDSSNNAIGITAAGGGTDIAAASPDDVTLL